ncbi:MAG TPA: CPBP family intramembrane glutamic endopeptidase [Candidatus Binataceae bacterium]|nr:CPBP family intramembrane glutamic endopeptidase [Candidatus Binataceae bacterium]
MRRYPLSGFFLITFGLTWGLGACFALFPAQLMAVFGKVSITNPLFIVAVYAPSLSAIIMTGLIDGLAGIQSLLGRVFHWRNGIQWYLAISVGIPLLTTIALLASLVFAGAPQAIHHWYDLFLLGPTGHEIVHALGSGSGGGFRVVLVILGSFLADPGPLGEELGWRGFALGRLLKQRSALGAAIILGIVWGAWHLPAFFIGGLPQSSMSIPVFMASIVALSVLMTWAFNGTRGSILIAILIHWTFNTCMDLTRMPIALFTAGVLVTAAVAVVICTGPALAARLREQESFADSSGNA